MSLHATVRGEGRRFPGRAGQRRPARRSSGKLAIWVGGDKAIFDKYKPVLDAMGDQARYIGPIGAGTIAKLVHNASGAAVNVVLSEVFTMGIKAGVEPLQLFAAIRQGAGGRNAAVRSDGRSFPHRQLRSGRFRVAAAAQGRFAGVPVGAGGQVPMRLTNLALQELTEALNRGWGKRDSPGRCAAAAGTRRHPADRGGTRPDQGRPGSRLNNTVERIMQLGAWFPLPTPAATRLWCATSRKSLEALGYDFLEAPDHVLGGSPNEARAEGRAAIAGRHVP